MKETSLSSKIQNAPLAPGCYIYRDKNGKVIYVGKAVTLRHRVKSYFVQPHLLDPKTRSLVPNIMDVEFVITDSELEALLLETNLIKKYRPKYNIMSKDDKNYVWLMIENKLDFPKISLVREKKDKNAEYFGPYPAKLPLRRILDMLRKVFPYRTCNRKIIQKNIINSEGQTERIITSSDTRPCLYYYLGSCQAPCAAKISKEEYAKNIQQIKLFFRNKKDLLFATLNEQMQKYSTDHKFEQAAQVRDKIRDLRVINERVHIDVDTDEIKFKQQKLQKRQQAVQDLIKRINLDASYYHENFKIECYDISNIQGKNAVGSMVVFVNGQPAKKLYRKFKIQTKETPDDFAMMQEVFRRRFDKSKAESDDESFAKFPDLIIVDGGKGQLSSAYEILNSYKLPIPVVGLAKRYEDIFLISEKDGELNFHKRTMPIGSEIRFLVQRIRDEAHRFGLNYHRKLRSKSQVRSILDDIPGVGKVIRLRLLKAFGSVENIKKASDSELLEVVKNKRTMKSLRSFLH